jgi:molybdenum cofactor cytidylyltransferase
MAIAGILLAAGAASRMGRNKLLLTFEEEPLVRRMARRALEAGLDPLIAVLGHEAPRAEEALRGLACRRVLNPFHAAGMNTSLSAGIGAVPPDCEAAVVVLADMPFVEVAMVGALLERWRETGAPVVASRYGGVVAPPTLYARALFPSLQGGTGEGRGRQVVRAQRQVEFVEWPSEALADLDVQADVEKARARLDARSGS